MHIFLKAFCVIFVYGISKIIYNPVELQTNGDVSLSFLLITLYLHLKLLNVSLFIDIQKSASSI